MKSARTINGEDDEDSGDVAGSTTLELEASSPKRAGRGGGLRAAGPDPFPGAGRCSATRRSPSSVPGALRGPERWCWVPRCSVSRHWRPEPRHRRFRDRRLIGCGRQRCCRFGTLVAGHLRRRRVALEPTSRVTPMQKGIELGRAVPGVAGAVVEVLPDGDEIGVGATGDVVGVVAVWVGANGDAEEVELGCVVPGWPGSSLVDPCRETSRGPGSPVTMSVSSTSL